MPSFTLTPSQVPHFLPLPGYCLLRVSPAESRIGSVYLPEDAAARKMERQAVREAVVVRNNPNPHRDPKEGVRWVEELREGERVFYLGKQDEADNDFVVVKHGQVVAVVVERGEHYDELMQAVQRTT